MLHENEFTCEKAVLAITIFDMHPYVKSGGCLDYMIQKSLNVWFPLVYMEPHYLCVSKPYIISYAISERWHDQTGCCNFYFDGGAKWVKPTNHLRELQDLAVACWESQ